MCLFLFPSLWFSAWWCKSLQDNMPLFGGGRGAPSSFISPASFKNAPAMNCRSNLTHWHCKNCSTCTSMFSKNNRCADLLFSSQMCCLGEWMKGSFVRSDDWLSLSFLFQQICFLVSAFRGRMFSEDSCATLALFSHYFYLSQFFWMLIQVRAD